MFRKCLILVLILAILVLVCLGLKYAKLNRQHNNYQTSGPLRCAAVVNLGKGFIGQTLKSTIILENISKNNVKLKNVQSSCGCTALLTNIDSIKGNTKVSSKIIMTLKKEGPNQETMVFPFESEEQHSPLIVKLTAFGEKPIKEMPKIVDFGVSVPEKLPLRKIITIKPHPDWGHPDLSVSGDGFRVKELGDDQYAIEAHQVSTGLTIRQLAIKSSKIPSASIDLPVHIRIKSNIEITPRSVFVGPISVGEEFEKNFKIQLSDIDETLSAISLDTSTDFKIALHADEEKGSWNLSIKGYCKKVGVRNDTVIVETLKKHEEEEINITVVGK